jgi:hypothetical protein
MKFRFDITKKMAASRANVIANYLDLEHLDMHSGLGDCEVLSETEHCACFTLVSRIGPFRVRNLHYYEFRPPDTIVNAVRSPIGPMIVTSTVREIGSGTPDVSCEVDVRTEIDLPKALYPFRRPLERLLRRTNRVILEEDRGIFERRQRLLGNAVGDYLRKDQYLLFKDAFRASLETVER